MLKQSILVINCGSSSLKFAVVNPQTGDTSIEGIAENLNGKQSSLTWATPEGKEHHTLAAATYHEALQKIAEILQQNNGERIIAVGHRVVHGGEAFKQSTLISSNVEEGIEACIPLAPLHNPANIAGIKVAKQLFPQLPHGAVFDTAFHQTMPPHAYVYPLPFELYEKHGVRRYGFHGTSHRYVTETAALSLGLDYHKSAFISAHLGNGCSATAVLNGRSIDTSMGLTPLEGLVMGTRCGDIDPSLHQYIAQQLKINLDDVTNLLNKQSGLAGISGIGFDMRDLVQAAEDGHKRAALAIEIFCYRLAKYLAALAVALGRIDALVFTGGIGENAAIIRTKTLARLKLLNFECSTEANQQHGQSSGGIITEADSTIAMVIKTDEQLAIARDVWQLIPAC